MDKSFENIYPEWEQLGLLGEGPFGKVYLAKSNIDGNDVYQAIKHIKVPAGREAVESAMRLGVSEDLLYTYFGKFKNDLSWELTMSKSAASENLASYDDVTIVDNAGYPGWEGFIRCPLYTPMADYFADNKPKPDDAIRMGRDISAALTVCASYGMVHGGICPENIMLTDDGRYVLRDFGIRRCLKKAGSGLFSNLKDDFDAPEVIGGNKYSNASDIYSLGMCMMYAANGGALPEGNDPDKINGISDEFKDILRRAVSRSAEARFLSAAQMKDELDNLPLGSVVFRRAAAVKCALSTVKRNGTISGSAASEAADEPAPKKKKSGKKFVGVAAMFLVLAVSATALYTLKPWQSAGGWLDVFGFNTENKNPVDVKDPDDGNKPNDVGSPDDPNGNNDVTVGGLVPATDKPVGTGEKDPASADRTINDNANGGNTSEPNNGGTTSKPNGGGTTSKPTTPSKPTKPTQPTKPSDPDEGYHRQVEPSEDVTLFPSNTQAVTRADLEGKTSNETYMLINEIYARHGKIFTTRSIQNYFEKQYWYEPTTTSSRTARDKMSELEKQNIEFIVAYQKEMGYR